MKVKHLLIFILIALISCTEPYPLQTENFENLLVVEATITNEFKKQSVKVSRTIPVWEVNEVIEKGATVRITTNTGLEFNFSEENNTYVSDLEFKIEPNIIYTLQIKTSNGNSYISTSEVSPSTTEIENVKSIQEIKDNVVGVAIKVDSYDATNSANFYRYEFEWLNQWLKYHKRIHRIWVNESVREKMSQRGVKCPKV